MANLTDITLCGQDPSLRNWGIALGSYNIQSKTITIKHIEVIQPVLNKSKQTRQNSLDIESGFQLFSNVYSLSKNVQFIFAEVPVGSQSSRAMCSYGLCTGVLGSLKGIGLPLIELTPTDVKMASVGNKLATKDDMIAWAVKKHPAINWPMHNKNISASKAEHMADAIATIYAGIKTPAFLQLLNTLEKI